MMTKYGSVGWLHDKETMHKIHSTSFTTKKYTLPSGRVIKLMGYEPQCLTELLKYFKEDNFDFDNVPQIIHYRDRKETYLSSRPLH